MRSTRDTTVDACVRRRAHETPDRIAYTFLESDEEAVRLSYAQLDARARAVASVISDCGVGQSPVLLLYPPGLDYLVAFYACLYAGVPAVPAYPPDPTRPSRGLARLRAIATDCGARAVLTNEFILGLRDEVTREAPELDELTWIATDGVTGSQAWDPPPVEPSSVAFLQYTSGSTGSPKGVVLTHQNLIHNLGLIQEGFGHTENSHAVIWLPPYHDMGLIGGIMQPLYAGFPATLMSPMSFLERPLRWLKAISDSRASTSGGPNFAFDLCVRKISAEERETLDLSTWEVAFCGAEPIRAETVDRFVKTFAPCGFRKEAFYACYGLAEGTLIISGAPKLTGPKIQTFDSEALATGTVKPVAPDAPKARPLVSSGNVLGDQSVVIVNGETLKPCAANTVGEVWACGGSVASGYWEKTELTEQVFQARTADGSGPFLRTGDLGFLLEGELFVAGRIKDVMILRGAKYYPQDLERTLEQRVPQVRPGSVAVFAVARDGEERVVAVAEQARGATTVAAPELTAAVRGVISEEHQLSLADFVLIAAGSMPKTSSGKIQRYLCREGYLAGTLEKA